MTTKNNKERSRRQEDKDSTVIAIPSLGFPRIFEEFMRPFDEFVQPLFPSSMGSMWTEVQGREPVVDFQDRGDHYVLTAELPGFEKNEVEVKVTSRELELKAEKTSQKESKGKDGTQSMSTRAYFHRYLGLPEEVVSEKVVGTMKNGVLELKLPKTEPRAQEGSRRVALK
ncbi:MAG TPA: Hsp20/alpha crystallin family protein [Nitrososphaerales archaeon]|nr:Hsp20/alpha crystallin family protein [Nitrososphaerales archaeon]